MKKEIKFVRENSIFYMMGLLIILGLKWYYRQADCDSLLWILAPTAHWVEFLSRIPFTYISGAGYVNHSLRMVIASSCSGVRFMIITFAMLTFSFVHMIASQRTEPVSRVSIWAKPDAALIGSVAAGKMEMLRAKARGLGWIAASAFLSWLFTVFVNGLRIIIAIYLPMYLEDAGLMRGMLTQDRLHTMIGVVVYFAALLTIYRLVGWGIQRIVKHGHSANMTDTYSDACAKHFSLTFLRKCLPPIFWYFVLTLGIPFLSRVYGGNTAGFMEFAVLVAGCCMLILLPYIIVLSLRRRG